MKKEEFYELLGDIDEGAVESAGKAPVKKFPYKRMIISAAAVVCVGFFVAVGVLLINNNKPSVTPVTPIVSDTTETTTAATQPSTAASTAAPTNPPATVEPTEKPTEKQESSDGPIDSGKSESYQNSEVSESSESGGERADGDSVQEYNDVRIYYVKNGKLYYDTVYMALNPQDIFELWKQKNDIGSEVALKEYRIEDNAWSEEISSGVGYYHVGDTFYLYITVSENLKDYYSLSSEELLTDSLKRTLSEYDIDDDGIIEFEEVYLILE